VCGGGPENAALNIQRTKNGAEEMKKNNVNQTQDNGKLRTSQEEKPSGDRKNEGRKTRDRSYYVKLAEETNSRVIMVNTADTYILTDLARMSDQGITRMRNQIMRAVEPEVFVRLMDQFNDALITLSHAVEKICETTGTRFKQPRGIHQILVGRENRNNTDITSKPIAE